MLPALLNALLLASLLTFSHGLLKWLAAQPSEGYVQGLLAHWWVLGLAIGIYVFVFFYYAYVLRGIAIGVLYPVYTGLSIVFVFAMGAVLFGESITPVQVLGCVLIVGGVFLVTGASR